MSIAERAAEWAERGIKVFPCGPDKAPLTQNGFKDATDDPAKAKLLFDFYGDRAALIGGAMGDGVMCVDVDIYKGDSVAAWLRERIDDGSMPPTRVHETPRGGLHFFYEGDVDSCVPLPGVDVKGEGGYVIVDGEGYKVKSEGLVQAPPALLETIRYTIANRRGSSMTALEANILSGVDFHDSLVQIAAKMADRGSSHTDIHKHLLELLSSSTASQPGHERHARWRAVMADRKGELSRIATSAYNKYSDDAIYEAIHDAEGNVMEELARAAALVFAPTPNEVTQPEPVYDDEKWPFTDGYFADEEHDLAEQSFTMYPIFAENESVVLFAEPKTGKTAIALTTALHIACGLDLGQFKVAEAGPTLYYGLEGTRAIRLRVAAWKKQKREEGVELPERIPMYVIEGHANFLKEEKRRDEANKIIAANRYAIKNGAGPLKAVYLDTLTKAMSGGDQNSVEDTSHLFELIGLLRAGGVTATIIFVHHKARTGTVRGSSNIEAEPDVLLDVGKQDDLVQLRIARARSIEDGARFHFRLVGVDLGQTKQGHPLAGVYALPVGEEPTDEVDQLGAEQLMHRRQAVVDMKPFAAVEDVLEHWFKLGLIRGSVRRGNEIAPPVSSAKAKEALAAIVTSAGGQPYDDYLIRKAERDGEFVGFTVHLVT